MNELEEAETYIGELEVKVSVLDDIILALATGSQVDELSPYARWRIGKLKEIFEGRLPRPG